MAFRVCRSGACFGLPCASWHSPMRQSLARLSSEQNPRSAAIRRAGRSSLLMAWRPACRRTNRATNVIRLRVEWPRANEVRRGADRAWNDHAIYPFPSNWHWLLTPISQLALSSIFPGSVPADFTSEAQRIFPSGSATTPPGKLAGRRNWTRRRGSMTGEAVVKVMRPAANHAVHRADRILAAARRRPVVEFPPDGIAQFLLRLLAGFHMRERFPGEPALPPAHFEAQEPEVLPAHVQHAGLPFVQRQTLALEINFAPLIQRRPKKCHVLRDTSWMTPVGRNRRPARWPRPERCRAPGRRGRACRRRGRPHRRRGSPP